MSDLSRIAVCNRTRHKKLHELTMPRNRYMVALVMVTFFVISLLTNIVGPLVPDIIQ